MTDACCVCCVCWTPCLTGCRSAGPAWLVGMDSKPACHLDDVATTIVNEDCPDHWLARQPVDNAPLFNLLRALPLQRLRRLTHDKRNFLLVLPHQKDSSLSRHVAPLLALPSGLLTTAPHVYRTLTCAVAASRPGDTVMLLPGCHQTPGPVHIPHVLLLTGWSAAYYGTEGRSGSGSKPSSVAGSSRAPGPVSAPSTVHHSTDIAVVQGKGLERTGPILPRTGQPDLGSHVPIADSAAQHDDGSGGHWVTSLECTAAGEPALDIGCVLGVASSRDQRMRKCCQRGSLGACDRNHELPTAAWFTL
jgi:hypothetical protein